jgi:hypothetical protein
VAGVIDQMSPEQATRLGQMLDRALWLVTALVCTYSLVNVHGVAVHHGTGDPQAWLLAPIVDIALIAAIRADSALSTSGAPPGPWAAALRWFAGLATWTLNVWDALFPLDPTDPHGAPLLDPRTSEVIHGHIDPGAVVSHSVPPVVLILLAEAAVAYRRAVARLVRQGLAAADELRQAHDRAAAAEAERGRVAGELEAEQAGRRRLADALTETAGELEAARALAAEAQTAREQALAALADGDAEWNRLQAAASDAADARERARAEQTAVLADLADTRAEAERLSRDLTDTAEELSRARADLDAALSRESSRAAAEKAAGKDTGRVSALAGWTGDATAHELAMIAAVADSVQLRQYGKRLTYSGAQRALGVRYGVAKAALDASRGESGENPQILPALSPAGTVVDADNDIIDAEILPMPSPRGRETAGAGGVR